MADQPLSLASITIWRAAVDLPLPEQPKINNFTTIDYAFRELNRAIIRHFNTERHNLKRQIVQKGKVIDETAANLSYLAGSEEFPLFITAGQRSNSYQIFCKRL